MVETLDPHCKMIFGYLVATIDKKTRFNDLYRTMNRLGYKMSKPTLSEHLKHLVEMKLTKREEEGIQTVTYRLYKEKWSNLEETVKLRNEFHEAISKAKKEFKSYSIRDQLILAFETMIWRDLRTLKKHIQWELDPKANFEAQLELLLLADPQFKDFEKWIIEECKESQDFCTKMYEAIDKLKKDTIGEEAEPSKSL